MGHLHPRALRGVPAAIVEQMPATMLRLALARIAFALRASGRSGTADPAPAPHLHRAVVVASAGGGRPLVSVRCARPHADAGAPPRNLTEHSRCSRSMPSHRNAGEHS